VRNRLCCRNLENLDYGGFRGGDFQYARRDERERMDKDSGMPGYRVYRSEINEAAKTLRLWVRRKRGTRKLVCSGCGQG